MMDQTAKYLAWRTLLDRGRTGWREEFVVLEYAGIVDRDKKNAMLRDPEELRRLLESGFSVEREALDAAEALVSSLGLGVAITDRAQECLLLLRALDREERLPAPVWRQQLSAELFGDSKHIGRTSILGRIYEGWLGRLPSRGEIRLKAFSSTPNRQKGPDLRAVTDALGQAVILPGLGQPERYDLDAVPLVVTCENLSPFVELELPAGLLLYTGGYASRGTAAWLRALPPGCPWVHFGDVDPDGLAIFEHLSMSSGRAGRFFPDQDLLDGLRPLLPAWKGPKGFRLDGCRTEVTRALAAWGLAHDMQVEQEQILYAMQRQGIDLQATLADSLQHG